MSERNWFMRWWTSFTTFLRDVNHFGLPIIFWVRPKWTVDQITDQTGKVSLTVFPYFYSIGLRKTRGSVMTTTYLGIHRFWRQLGNCELVKGHLYLTHCVTASIGL